MNEHRMGHSRALAIRGGFGGLAGRAHATLTHAAGSQAQAHHLPIRAAVAKPPTDTGARAVSGPELPRLRR